MDQDNMDDTNKYATPEQLRYAKVLAIGVQAGFAVLVVTFVLYLTGVLAPLVPLADLPKYWTLPVAEYVKATHTPTGWGWFMQLDKGDLLTLLGIAVLAGAPIISNLAVLPIFARRSETAQIIISALLISVLVISASNVLTGL